MQFDSRHIVILDSLTQQQAEELLEFLAEEKVRHIKCVEAARLGMLTRPLIASIYESAICRHQKDLVGIDAKVLEIHEKFLSLSVV